MEPQYITPDTYFQERRQPRLALDGPVFCRDVLKPEEPFVESKIRDISSGGLRMSVSAVLEQDAQLVVEMDVPSLPQKVRTIARVVWIRKDWPSMACECGLQFVQILPEDQEAITDCVERGVVARAKTAHN